MGEDLRKKKERKHEYYLLFPQLISGILKPRVEIMFEDIGVEVVIDKAYNRGNRLVVHLKGNLECDVEFEVVRRNRVLRDIPKIDRAFYMVIYHTDQVTAISDTVSLMKYILSRNKEVVIVPLSYLLLKNWMKSKHTDDLISSGILWGTIIGSITLSYVIVLYYKNIIDIVALASAYLAYIIILLGYANLDRVSLKNVLTEYITELICRAFSVDYNKSKELSEAIITTAINRDVLRIENNNVRLNGTLTEVFSMVYRELNLRLFRF